MVIKFRAREINRGKHKLIQISILIKKIKLTAPTLKKKTDKMKIIELAARCSSDILQYKLRSQKLVSAS